ncbi:MAG: stage V sporulation protein AD [Oscillospiraceae bacterium]|nr:stage V sporulation protein AD [Oscillospiraceae bacterium]
MAKRIARSVIEFSKAPAILGQAAVAGKIEAEGPLAGKFSEVFMDERLGQPTWEQAETALQAAAIMHAMAAANCSADDIDLHIGGDLINQCTATGFALRDENIPFAGVYAACASFALALALAANLIESGGMQHVSCCGSSHFCAAEKQFRYPLELGVQPTPTAQRTATAAGAIVLSSASDKPKPRITRAIFGNVIDMGVTDPSEMGAAMAPAAWDTLRRFFQDTNTQPSDYDLILTGDLSQIGTHLLHELARQQAGLDLALVHRDCGLMLYDLIAQDVGTGGSGLGCSAAVLCAEVLPRMLSGELKRVLFIGTGALLSAVSPLQGESIPAVAHGVLIEMT